MAGVSDILAGAKTAAAALGVGGVLWSAYSVSGLPVPATIAQVDKRIEVVRDSVQGLSVDVIETQRSVLALRKAVLRNEKYTLQHSLENGDAQTKTTLTRRIGEIDDELSDIEKQDDLLASKARGIRASARAPA